MLNNHTNDVISLPLFPFRIGGAALVIAAASYAYTIEPVAGAVVGVVLAAAMAAAYFVSIQQKVGSHIASYFFVLEDDFVLLRLFSAIAGTFDDANPTCSCF